LLLIIANYGGNELVIKAVFFDLDDTLHNSQIPFTDAFKKVFPGDHKQVHFDSLYKKFRDFSDLLWRRYVNNEITLEKLRIERLVLALKSANIKISDELANEFQKSYEIGLKSLRLFPEVPELLETIKRKEYKIGIITNGPIEHQYNKIKSLNLTKYIPREWIFISDEVGAAKPNSQIFHHVSQRVGFSPSELLYIGDSWVNDVVGSCEAGWQSIWYNHRKREPGSNHKPIAEVDCLSSVIILLSNQNVF
jgi:HAD superfamily hydrolase (TIGR01549 family)